MARRWLYENVKGEALGKIVNASDVERMVASGKWFMTMPEAMASREPELEIDDGKLESLKEGIEANRGLIDKYIQAAAKLVKRDDVADLLSGMTKEINTKLDMAVVALQEDIDENRDDIEVLEEINASDEVSVDTDPEDSIDGTDVVEEVDPGVEEIEPLAPEPSVLPEPVLEGSEDEVMLEEVPVPDEIPEEQPVLEEEEIPEEVPVPEEIPEEEVLEEEQLLSINEIKTLTKEELIHYIKDNGGSVVISDTKAAIYDKLVEDGLYA